MSTNIELASSSSLCSQNSFAKSKKSSKPCVLPRSNCNLGLCQWIIRSVTIERKDDHAASLSKDANWSRDPCQLSQMSVSYSCFNLNTCGLSLSHIGHLSIIHRRGVTTGAFGFVVGIMVRGQWAYIVLIANWNVSSFSSRLILARNESCTNRWRVSSLLSLYLLINEACISSVRAFLYDQGLVG